MVTQERTVVSLNFSSVFTFMDTVHDVADSLLGGIGFDEDARYWLTIAVREAVANAIKHGNKMDSDKEVDVRFEISPDKFTVRVRDSGDGFSPASIPNPTDPKNLLRDKGRGIYYIRTFMDEVHYEFEPRVGTTIIMVKRLGSVGNADS